MTPIRPALLLALCLAAFATRAADPAWPAKALRVIVPVAAGSSTDTIPRVVMEQLAAQLAQPVVVENRSGAGGTIGSALVARADADGYTILAHGSAHTLAPAFYPKLGYDAAREFAAVVPLGISAQALVVSPAKGFRTLSEFVAAARQTPGTFNFSSVGIGTATHMAAERFRFSAGVEAAHVPFKGGAEAMTEAASARVDFFFGPVGLVLPFVREGRLVALAVNGTDRALALPDVPTTREAGFVNAEYPIWYGLFVPAKTPRSVVDLLHRETRKALRSPKVLERFGRLAVDPMEMTPVQFDAYVAKEIALNAGLVKAIGIKPD